MRSRRGNRVAPAATDGYDSTEHRHKPPVSRQSSRKFKGGRSQRGRPFSQQSMVGGGRVSRGVAQDARQELAWMDTGAGGVQLMRVQPLVTAPPPMYSLPPTASVPPVQVQPRPQGVGSLAQEKLPALNSAQTQSFTQRQLETYFRVSRCDRKSACLKDGCFPISRFIKRWRDYSCTMPHQPP